MEPEPLRKFHLQYFTYSVSPIVVYCSDDGLFDWERLILKSQFISNSSICAFTISSGEFVQILIEMSKKKSQILLNELFQSGLVCSSNGANLDSILERDEVWNGFNSKLFI